MSSLSQDQLRRQREAAVALFETNELSIADVARRVGVSRQACSGWHTLWQAQGAAALEPKNPGPAPRLSTEQKEQIAQLLVEGPSACGYAHALWTLERIADLIEKTTGVHYHPSHVWRLLKEMGFSSQKPARRAKERDEEAIAGWLANEWPAIKRGPSSGKTL